MTTAEFPGITAKRTVLIDKPPREVWAALTEPEQLRRWLAASVTGRVASACQRPVPVSYAVTLASGAAGAMPFSCSSRNGLSTCWRNSHAVSLRNLIAPMLLPSPIAPPCVHGPIAMRTNGAESGRAVSAL